MKNKFVRTGNVKAFIGLIENLKNKPKNVPKMGLVYGEPGLGKSQAALWLSFKYESVYVRCVNKMTTRWLLEEIAKELDEIPRYMTSDIFNQCVSSLQKHPKIVIIDEIDYLLNDNKTVETLRDLHDKADCPVIFLGMGLAHKKIERYKHIFDRCCEVVKFEAFKVSEIKEILNELCEIPVSASAIEILHKKHNRFRQILEVIYEFEKVAKENNLTEITAETAEVILC